MPANNPAAYANGQQQARQDLGLQPSMPKAPSPPKFQAAAIPAAMPTPPKPTPPRPTSAPGVGMPPSAAVAYNAFSTAQQNATAKNAAFSLSPNPATRVTESRRDTVRQPATNEDRNVATGIDPAFGALNAPSESDPYTIPRMF